MATFMFSIDFFKKLELKYYNSILFALTNHHCTHTIALDNEKKLLTIYGKVCKYGESFNEWLKYIDDDRLFPLDDSINPETIKDEDIFLMTDKINDDKKMVVHNKKSTTSYYPPKGKNPADFASIINHLEADELINCKTNKTINITVESGAVFTGNNINQ
jgi:hypothetical protein